MVPFHGICQHHTSSISWLRLCPLMGSGNIHIPVGVSSRCCCTHGAQQAVCSFYYAPQREHWRKVSVTSPWSLQCEGGSTLSFCFSTYPDGARCEEIMPTLQDLHWRITHKAGSRKAGHEWVCKVPYHVSFKVSSFSRLSWLLPNLLSAKRPPQSSYTLQTLLHPGQFRYFLCLWCVLEHLLCSLHCLSKVVRGITGLQCDMQSLIDPPVCLPQHLEEFDWWGFGLSADLERYSFHFLKLYMEFALPSHLESAAKEIPLQPLGSGSAALKLHQGPVLVFKIKPRETRHVS